MVRQEKPNGSAVLFYLQIQAVDLTKKMETLFFTNNISGVGWPPRLTMKCRNAIEFFNADVYLLISVSAEIIDQVSLSGTRSPSRHVLSAVATARAADPEAGVGHAVPPVPVPRPLPGRLLSAAQALLRVHGSLPLDSRAPGAFRVEH